MQTFVDNSAASLDVAVSAMKAMPITIKSVRMLDDVSLIKAQRSLAEMRRHIDASAALVAGEVSHRSRRELGYSGLAQREGFRTPQALVQHATGSGAHDALALLQAGAMVHEALTSHISAESSSAAEPWLTSVGVAVNRGELSVAGANAIRSGLGSPSAADSAVPVTTEQLAAAVNALMSEASDLNADRLFRRARELRDELDAEGIADRERVLYEQRSMRRVRRPNGLSRYIIDPDLESAVLWDDLYDKLTSPRRGGARFVEEHDRAWAEEITRDTRTTEQYVHDSFTSLLTLAINSGTDASRRVIGSRLPAVRILVTAESLIARTGHGQIEGCDMPVSIETAERAACTSGTIAIVFDESGQVINLGREQRLYSGSQRIALAARDGGCRWPGCDRPPGWTEAHHIKHWKRDQGATDLADGILLCRHHHMLVHNNHWEIRRKGADYWLVPPPDIDPRQVPRPMPTKSRALRELRREHVAS